MCIRDRSGSEWLCEYVASLSEFDEIDFVALTGDNFSDASGLAMLKSCLLYTSFAYLVATSSCPPGNAYLDRE